MAKIVNNYTAILSGYSWWGQQVARKPIFITYSFETRPYDWLDDSGYSAAFIKSFRPLTTLQKVEAEAALNDWDNASGIRFLRAPAGQGDIRFGNYKLDNAAGLGTYPVTEINRNQAYSLDSSGDIFLDTSTAKYSSNDLHHLLLHEIGHGIGLKHSFDGAIRLDARLDNTDYTVMSYNGYSPVLGPYDIAAARYLYGRDTQDGDQVASWSWNPRTATLTQKGDAGGDTIRGVSTADVIYGMGGNDTIFGSAGNDKIFGSAGKDIVFGGSGNDTMSGGFGRDVLTGGDGADRFVFDSSFKGGVDRVKDFTHDSDKVVLDHTVFSKLAIGRLPASQFHVGTAAHDANDRIIFDDYSTALYYDSDGTGVKGQVRIAVLDYSYSLTASDFLIVA